ncbi:MAG: hypothetical protein ACXWJC_08155 [Croceibacterium sp.]
MVARHFSFFAPACAAFVAATLVTTAARAEDATTGANCTPQLTGLQQRLYQRANEGPGALREFIFIRRAILQLDTYETAAWAGSVSEARATCLKKSASSEASPKMAS